jgi:hypothetical protein
MFWGVVQVSGKYEADVLKSRERPMVTFVIDLLAVRFSVSSAAGPPEGLIERGASKPKEPPFRPGGATT